MTHFTRSLFDAELANLEAGIIQMASLVETALTNAFAALSTHDGVLAEEVVAGDSEINRLRFEIEEKAQLVLATQQPAARDLRFIIAVIHIATELERMGDHAAGIARIATRLEGVPITDLDWSRLNKMVKRAEKMLSGATQAFANRDVDAAWAITDRDQKLDRHYQKFFVDAIEHINEESRAEMGTYMLWVAHNLERIGDRATNIAERVVFMVTGRYTEVLEDYV